jgi:flagellar hook-length control protein FliK
MPTLPMPAAQTQAGPLAVLPTGRRDMLTIFPAPASFADSMVAVMAAPSSVVAAATVQDSNPPTSSGTDTVSQIAMVAPIVGTGPVAADATLGGVAPVRPDASAGKTGVPPPTRSGKNAGNDATVTDVASQLVTPQLVTSQLVTSQTDALPILPAQPPASQPAASQPSTPQSPVLQQVERGLSMDGTKVATQPLTATVAKSPPLFPSPAISPSPPAPSSMLPIDPAPSQDASLPGPQQPQQPQQPEQPWQAAGARVDAGPRDRIQAPAASASPTPPDAPESSPAKEPLALAAATPAPADPGPDALLHAVVGQIATAAVTPPTSQARTAVPADTRLPPSVATVQVMPAIVSLAAGVGGSHSMTLRLDPASLGAVQIRIDRSGDAPARVDIIADRPDTLALLQGDQHHLQQALDQAGIPAEGRQLSFHAATPSPDGTTQPSRSDIGPGDPGQRQGQAWQNGPRTPREQGGPGGEAALDGATMQVASGWLRAGIDITA